MDRLTPGPARARWRTLQPPRGAAVLVVSIGARRVEAALQQGGVWRASSEVQVAIEPAQGIVQPHEAVAVALSQLRELLQRSAAPAAGTPALRGLRVLVAERWLTVASLPWSGALAQRSAWEPQARVHLAATGYPTGAADTVRLDDAAYGQPRLALVFPAALMAALGSLAAGLGTALESVLPLSAAAWAALPRGGAQALAVLDDGFTAVVQGRGRHIGELIVRGHLASLAEAAAPARALQGLWRRLRARDAQLARLQKLAVLDLAQLLAAQQGGPEGGPARASGSTQAQGHGPDGAHEGRHGAAQEPAATGAASPDAELQPIRWPAGGGTGVVSVRLQLAALAATRGAATLASLDAAPGGPQAPPWLRWAAAASVVAAAVLLAQAWQQGRQRQALAAELAAQQAAPAPVVRSVPWTREELGRVQAVNAAVRELNLPISALLAALQPPADLRVAVLGVDVTSGAQAAAGTSSVKISAQARAGADMARYVAYVAQRRPFDSAYLVRHEIAGDAPDRPYRFTVEAAWKE